MIFKNYFLLLLVSLFFVSCKKDYQCECTNAFGTYDAGDKIEAGSKNKAEKKCSDLSSSSTTCKVK